MKEWGMFSFMPCHRIPERSLIVNGRQFPLCFRCMGILMGIIMGIPSAWLLLPSLTLIHLLMAGIFIVPLLADGFTQKWNVRGSTNVLRLVTGVLCGVGLAIGIVFCSKWGVSIIMMLTSLKH
ncbi:DUF2085 domain-containing protein [Bacillus sp. AFS015802]|uniref:DUF2085 domain-containing protein n=1 Tax=Bacillus sp. AFS015802 TaxID=2033486 RepID=UPI0015CF3410|nr:DUF2085 domain-containing protein [Bacillus sp. AFS015802]